MLIQLKKHVSPTEIALNLIPLSQKNTPRYWCGDKSLIGEYVHMNPNLPRSSVCARHHRFYLKVTEEADTQRKKKTPIMRDYSNKEWCESHLLKRWALKLSNLLIYHRLSCFLAVLTRDTVDESEEAKHQQAERGHISNITAELHFT